MVTLCLIFPVANAQKKLLILGSSTSACMGPSTPANCFVNRLKAWYNRNSTTLVIDNRAVGGYSVYKSMPKGTVPPAGRDTVQPYFNITDGLASNPDFVLINYPSNGYDTYTVDEVMRCFRTIRQAALHAGKPCYITTTQPRTSFTTAGREKLRILKDSILAVFGSSAIDFWTGIADPFTLAIAPPYQVTGDQVHLNDDAHAILFNRVLEKKLLPDPVTLSANPVAQAGNDLTVNLPARSAVLDGTPSTAPGSLIASYKWNLLSGPTGAFIRNPYAGKTVVDSLVQGVYYIRLTVTNSEGKTATDDIQVKVNPTSTLIAHAGKDETIQYGQATVLRGDNSTSSAGAIISFQWTKYAGPASYELLTPTSKASWIRNMSPGTYVFRLTIKDADGLTATDDVAITVLQPQIVARAGADLIIAAPTSGVTLDGSKSSASGLTISSYNWSFIAGPAGSSIISPASAITEITGLVVGKYVFRLTVKSSTGIVSVDDVAVTVNEKTAASTTPVANAGADEKIPVGQATVLRGTASIIPVGATVTYQWTKYSGPSMYEMLSPASSSTWIRNMVAGIYIFRLTITDSYGNRSSDDVMIVVTDPTPTLTTFASGSGMLHDQPLPTTDPKTLTIFPNPVTSQAKLQHTSAFSGKGTISVFDASGILVKKISVTKNNPVLHADIPMQELSHGVYTVELKMENRPAIFNKIFKN
jgi:hypothetical protein